MMKSENSSNERKAFVSSLSTQRNALSLSQGEILNMLNEITYVAKFYDSS